MNQMIVGLALASTAVPVTATEAVTMRFDCPTPTARPAQPPELSGIWDMVMNVGGIPSFGLLSVAAAGTELTGSLALNAGVVAVRSLKSDSQAVAMIVASAEGDVRFDGSLTSDGKRMCGIVSYHGGQKFDMVAQKRPARVTGPTNGEAAR